jgi:hypothetical protein
MHIYKTITKVPGGLMVVPLFTGMVINTFFPHLLKIGGFDENLGRKGVQLLSNEELEATRRIRSLGYAPYYDPAVLVYHKVQPERVSQAWLRRRVAWQAISDALLPSARGRADGARNWAAIADYGLRVPPEMRSLRGLFYDTEDAETLYRQCEAISALLRLLMFDSRDPEREPEK